jgi:hypothetical protein
MMNRRGAITAIGGLGISVLSGCTSGGTESSTDTETETVSDTDGDGVPDFHDYAPRDPAVQSKSDTVGRTTQTPPEETATPEVPAPQINLSELGTPPGPAPEQLPTNTIPANAGPLLNYGSTFTQNSLQQATVQIVAETLTNSYPLGAKLFVVAAPYPDELFAPDESYGNGLSDPFLVSDTTTNSVTIEFNTVPEHSFYLAAALVPRSATLETLDAEDAEYLAETDRLRIVDGTLRFEEPDIEVDAFSTAGFERKIAEGCYILEFDGRIGIKRWSASFVAYKSNYVDKAGRFRSADRASYVRRAEEDGTSIALALILDEEAEANGFTDQYEKVDFIIDFVQNLPYVPDNVSTDFDDYTKSVIETLVEGGGDCEDSAILMAAVLQADSFNYDCILIQPPGHMAVGVYGTDLPGAYWEYEGRRYYYLETTGDGWSVGKIPEEYEGASAYLYDV